MIDSAPAGGRKWPLPATGVTGFCAFLALALSFATSNAAPFSKELGERVGEGVVQNGYVGSLRAEPAHAPVGAQVSLIGEGLAPNQTYDLVWGTVEGKWLAENGEYNGRSFEPANYRIASVQTDAKGSFSKSFITPDDFGFMHDIIVQQKDRIFTKTGFSIDMSVKITPDSGPVGTPISFDITGIGWRQLEGSWEVSYDNAFTGWISSITQHGAAKFTIPATGRPGDHVIQIIHGEFTFPYLNMQQNPEPDRPRFQHIFKITHDAPVLPPPPDKQIQASVRDLSGSGALRVEPAFAAVGQAVEVHGEGFEPNKSFALDWGTVTGNRISATQWQQRWTRIVEASSDAQGKVAFRFETPDDLGGAHEVRVETRSGPKTGSAWVIPTAKPLDVGQGPPGTPFTIHLKGVGWTDTANIYTLVYDNVYAGYACGFNSQGDVEIFMKASGDPGWHYIDLYPAIYRGKETRPNNFRIPQLTFAEDHPGEDLPAFRFAFEVTDSEVKTR